MGVQVQVVHCVINVRFRNFEKMSGVFLVGIQWENAVTLVSCLFYEQLDAIHAKIK